MDRRHTQRARPNSDPSTLRRTTSRSRSRSRRQSIGERTFHPETDRTARPVFAAAPGNTPPRTTRSTSRGRSSPSYKSNNSSGSYGQMPTWINGANDTRSLPSPDFSAKFGAPSSMGSGSGKAKSNNSSSSYGQIPTWINGPKDARSLPSPDFSASFGVPTSMGSGSGKSTASSRPIRQGPKIYGSDEPIHEPLEGYSTTFRPNSSSSGRTPAGMRRTGSLGTRSSLSSGSNRRRPSTIVIEEGGGYGTPSWTWLFFTLLAALLAFKSLGSQTKPVVMSDACSPGLASLATHLNIYDVCPRSTDAQESFSPPDTAVDSNLPVYASLSTSLAPYNSTLADTTVTQTQKWKNVPKDGDVEVYYAGQMYDWAWKYQTYAFGANKELRLVIEQIDSYIVDLATSKSSELKTSLQGLVSNKTTTSRKGPLGIIQVANKTLHNLFHPIIKTNPLDQALETLETFALDQQTHINSLYERSVALSDKIGLASDARRDFLELFEKAWKIYIQRCTSLPADSIFLSTPQVTSWQTVHKGDAYCSAFDPEPLRQLWIEDDAAFLTSAAKFARVATSMNSELLDYANAGVRQVRAAKREDNKVSEREFEKFVGGVVGKIEEGEGWLKESFGK